MRHFDSLVGVKVLSLFLVMIVRSGDKDEALDELARSWSKLLNMIILSADFIRAKPNTGLFCFTRTWASNFLISCGQTQTNKIISTVRHGKNGDTFACLFMSKIVILKRIRLAILSHHNMKGRK